LNTQKLDWIILDALRSHPDGGTSEEISEWTNLRLVTVSPSLRPMARLGLVIATEERRRNRSGVRAIVWKIAPGIVA
jgi:DNA-binding IclR family transcriptional regulator